MCGRFTQPGDIEIIRDLKVQYGVDVNADPGDAAPPVNREQTLIPFNDVNVIFTGREGVIRLGAMYWQLIQPWNEEFKSRYTCFNVRMESMIKQHNERLLREQRCILPVRSFFETRKIGGVAVKPKESYEFALKSGKLVPLGGIYAVWVNPEDENDRRYSCSIITLEPNEIVGEVHDRMPLVLDEPAVKAWLDPLVTDFDELMGLIRPLSSHLLERSRAC